MATLHTPATCPTKPFVEQHDRDIRELRSDRDAAKGSLKVLVAFVTILAGAVSAAVAAAIKALGGP